MVRFVFETILVAGTGDEARRLERACERIGVALAVADAPENPTEATSLEVLLATAKRTGAGAIYATQDNPTAMAALAAAVRHREVGFVGPSNEALALFADKAAMKERASQAGLGVVPYAGPFDGWSPEVEEEAEHLGYPIVVKPTAGWRGLGVRVVTRPEDLKPAVEGAVELGNDRLLSSRFILEPHLARARELEVTVLVDEKGRCGALPERELSTRTPDSPWLLESPSPLFTLERNHGDEQQAALAESAQELALAFKLRGVATFEFLVAPGGNMVFLEANAGSPRGQLMAELASETDLAEAEVRLTAGEPVPFEGLGKNFGHAFEGWVRAVPKEQDAPLKTMRFPQAPLRKARGEAVTVTGDTPMTEGGLLARVATLAPIRHQAMLQLDRYLAETELAPVDHNIADLRSCLHHESFRAGQLDLAFVTRAGFR